MVVLDRYRQVEVAAAGDPGFDGAAVGFVGGQAERFDVEAGVAHVVAVVLGARGVALREALAGFDAGEVSPR